MAKYEGVPTKDIISKLWANIKAAFVAKESGKGLSTNDFTNDYKTKLDGLVKVKRVMTSISAQSSDVNVASIAGENVGYVISVSLYGTYAQATFSVINGTPSSFGINIKCDISYSGAVSIVYVPT